MKVFNRVVVILGILLLTVLLIIAAVVPNTVLEDVLYTTQQAQDALLIGWPRSYVFFLAVDVILIFLLVVLLWFELRPAARKTVTIRSVSGAQAEVSTASVQQSLEYHISEIGDVIKVRPTVRGKRRGVDVVIDLETLPEIDIPAKMEEVSQAAREIVERKMGLKVANLKVRMRQARHGRARAVGPTPAPPPMPTPTPPAMPTVTPSVPFEPVDTGIAEEPAVEPRSEETDPYSIS
jgi:hypothetical protein